MKRASLLAARLILALCLLPVMTPALPAGAADAPKLPPEARQALAKAQVLLDKEEFSQAATIISDYVKDTRETIQSMVYLMLGGARYKAGDRAGALEAFRTGHRAWPKDEHLAMNTAALLYELDHHAEAGRQFEKAAALQDPFDPETLYQAGSAYYSGGDLKSSARVLGDLLNRTTKPRKEWVHLAIHAFMETGRKDKALDLLMRYLNSTPEEDAYWEMLAGLHLDKNDLAEACAAFEVCCLLRKPEAAELERLASLYAYLDAPLLAAGTLTRAWGQSPGAERTRKLVALYASAGRLDKAMDLLNRHPNNHELQLIKGRLLFEARRFGPAREALEKCLARGEDSEARFLLALCAWEDGDWKHARGQFSRLARDKGYARRAKGYLTTLDDLDGARRAAVP